MVGIYKYAGGLQLVAVSESYESAVDALAERFKDSFYGHLTNMQWWEIGKRDNCGAPRCYAIKEIEVW